MHHPLHETTNTATWVDELYGARLARQHLDYISPELGEDNPLTCLSALQASRLYLRQELVRTGPGVKKSIRAYFVDLTPSEQGPPALSIKHCDYDPRNGEIRKRTAAVPVHIALSEHAVARLHERLRTNALGDVIRIALRPLSRVPAPARSEWARQGLVLHLVGFGIFPAKVILAEAPHGVRVPCWGVLTFLDTELRPQDVVAHTIGPQR